MLAPTIPEFSTLPPKAQDRLFEFCLGRSTAESGVAIYGMLAVVGLIISVTLLLLQCATEPGICWWVFVAGLDFFVGTCAALLVVRIAAGLERRKLREAIGRLFPDGVLPECFACGYDLRGTREATCPECGANTVLSDERGRPRPPGPRGLEDGSGARARLLYDRQALALARRRVVPWVAGVFAVLALALLLPGHGAWHSWASRYPLFPCLIFFGNPLIAWLIHTYAARIRTQLEIADRTPAQADPPSDSKQAARGQAR